MVDSGLKNDKDNYKTDRDRRYAFEGYVRSMDKWYWGQTMELVGRERGKLKSEMATLLKKNIAISATTLIIQTVIWVIMWKRCKSQRQSARRLWWPE